MAGLGLDGTATGLKRGTSTMLSQRARILLDTLMPAAEQADPARGLFEAGFDAFWSEFERTTLPAVRRMVRAAVFAAIWISPLLIGRLPPLGRHDRPTRERALAAMAHSRSYLLRQMLQLLKTTASFHTHGTPPVEG